MNSTLKFYISQLNPKRAKIHTESWFNVGKAIYFNTKENNEGQDIWHEFSKQNIKYNKEVCDKKWLYFMKKKYIYSLRQLIPYIYEDNGTTYNPDHDKFVENKDVRNLIYTLLPKLSVRRMRNMKALNNLCSALYYISSGEDKHVLTSVCKRIKDSKLKNIFTSFWERTYFYDQYGINNIITWINNDEKEKFMNRKPGVKIKSYLTIELYHPTDLEWVEKTLKNTNK